MVTILYIFYIHLEQQDNLKGIFIIIINSIVRDTAGTAVALTWTMKNIMGVKKGDVYFSASDIGWVVGHSFIVYGPLLTGATTSIHL